MADETINPNTEGDQQQQDAGEGLHIHGRGHEALEDGQQQPGETGQQQGSEDVFGNANVQSGRRSTFEGMIDGQPDPGSSVADQSPIVGGEYTPEDPDGDVDARFDAVQPDNGRGPAGGPDTGEEEDDDAGDEDAERDPALERPEDRVPGDGDDTGAGDQAPPPGDDPDAPAFAATEPPAGDAGAAGDEALPADDEPEDPLAETPTLTAADADGIEDQPIRLDLSAALTDIDGTEELTVTVSGVPDGFSFTDTDGIPIGTDLGGGTWSIPPAQLDDLYLARPEHFSGDVPLTVTATATEVTGETNTATTSFTVTVEAVADAPVLSAEDAAGTENQWHDLSISAALVDADGSESLTVYVTDVPEGATLDQGTRLGAPVTLADGTVLAAGTWAMTAAQAENVRIMPPENDSADFSLRVYAETTEDSNGDRAVTGPAAINVDVAVVAPSVGGQGIGGEDQWTALDLSANVNAELGDETLQVLLEGLPEHAVLRDAQTGQVLDTSAPLDITALMDRLEVRWGEDTPMEHSDDDISFNLRAVVTDVDGDTNQTTTGVTAVVNAIADAPDLTVTDAAGVENQWHKLTITSGLVDDDGSESLTVYVTDVPEGAALDRGAALTEPLTLANGTVLPAGTWAMTAAEAAEVSILPPTNDSADFTLRVFAETTEDSNGHRAVSGPEEIDVDVAVVAPSVEGEGTGGEDLWTTLDLSANVNAELGDETLEVFLNGLPADAEVRVNGQTYTAADGEIDITGHLDDVQVRWRQDSDHQHSDDDISFSLRAVVTDVDGDTNQTTTGVTAVVNAIADAPDLTVTDAAGVENQWHKLTITSGLVDDDGSESLTVYVTDVPAGAALDRGAALTEPLTLANGTVLPAGTWAMTAAEAAEVSILPPTNDSADFTLRVFAETTEDSNGHRAVSGPEEIDVDVAVVAPSVEGEGTGGEDLWTTLDLSANVNAELGDETLEVFLNGLPADAEVRVNGQTYTAADGEIDITGHLDDVQVRWRQDSDHQHSDDDISFNLRAVVTDVDGDTNQTTTGVTAVVNAIADAPDLTVTDAAGVENQWHKLTITSGLVDDDGSESLTVYVTDVPEGATLDRGAALAEPLTLANGTVLPAGTWAMTAAEAAEVSILPPTNDSADFTLRVFAETTEDSNGHRAVSGPEEIDVDVAVVAPSVEGEGTGGEDLWTTLDLSANVNAELGDETLEVFLNGLPADAEVRVNGQTYTAADGEIDITGHLDDVQVRWRQDSDHQHSDDDISFNLRAVVTDVDGDTNQTTTGVTAVVNAIADAPDLTVTDAAGVENQWHKLTITSGLVDDDGSESLTVYVTDVPEGATLDRGAALAEPLTLANGTVLPAGTWAMTAAEAAEVSILPPTNDSADFTLRVFAETTEDSNGHRAVSGPEEIDVDVAVVAPSVEGEGTGGEDLWTTLDLSANVNAELGDETLEVFLNGLPADAEVRVNGQTYTAADGEIDITGHLDDVQVRWRQDSDHQHSDDDISFSLRAVVTDVDGDTNQTTTGVTAVVNAIADAPDLGAQDIGVVESAGDDAWVNLDVTALGLVDAADGSESLTLYVSGVPEGGDLRLPAGVTGATLEKIDNASIAPTGIEKTDAGETLTLTGTVYKITFAAGADALAIANGMEVRPPANSSADFDLKLAAVSTEANGETDYDGQPEQNWRTADVHVDVGVATPTVTSANNSEGAEGTDWTAVTGLSVTIPALTDGQGEETVTLTVSGPDLGTGPNQASLRLADGTPLALKDGTTDTFVIPNEAWNPGTGEISGLQVRWNDDDRSGPITFTLDAHLVDIDKDGDHFDASGPYADQSSAQAQVTVDILPVSDGADLSSTADAVGVEDQWTALNLSWSVNDTDSEQVTAVTLSGLPDGTTIWYPGESGFLSVDAVDGAVSLPASLTTDQQAKVFAEWPDDLSTAEEADDPATAVDETGKARLTLSVTTAETGADPSNAAAQATTTTDFLVTVFGDADPAVGLHADSTPHVVAEDIFYDVQWGEDADIHAALDDPNAETLQFLITPDDSGSRLMVKGQLVDQEPGGGWLIDAADMGSLSIAGPEYWGSIDANDSRTFTVQAITTEADADADTAALNGLTNPKDDSTLSRQGTATVTVGDLVLKTTAVANPISFVQASVIDSMMEDNDTPEEAGDGIAVAPEIRFTDTDGSEDLTGHLIFETSDLAMLRGALTLADGTKLAAYEVTTAGTDGAMPILGAEVTDLTTLDETKTYAFRLPVDQAWDQGNGVWKVSGLTFTPAEHDSHDITYSLYAETREEGNGAGLVARTTDGRISVAAVVDPVSLVDEGTLKVGTDEDAAHADGGLSLDQTLLDAVVANGDGTKGLTDTDGSETLYVYVTIPAGTAATSTLTKDGNGLDKIDDWSAWETPDGNPLYTEGETYGFKIESGDDLAAVLSKIKLVTDEGVSADMTLTIDAVTVDTDPDTGLKDISRDTTDVRVDIGTVAPVLTAKDGPDVTMHERTVRGGDTEAWHDLDLSQHLDLSVGFRDGSETVSVRLYGIPNHVNVRNATQGSDDMGSYWEVSEDQLDAVKLQMKGWGKFRDADFDITARAVVQDVDAFNPAMATAAGEDYADTAYSIDTATITVNVLGRADEAKITVNGKGLEDSWESLSIDATPKDTNSETVTKVTLTGLPAGMELRVVEDPSLENPVVKHTITVNADGSAVIDITADASTGITAADLKNNLQFRASDDSSTYDGPIQIGIAVTTTEAGVDGGVLASAETYTTNTTYDLEVFGDADTPTIGLNESDAGTAEPPPTHWLPADLNALPHGISNIVLYLQDEGSTTVYKVKIDNFGPDARPDGFTGAWPDDWEWAEIKDIDELNLDSFISNSYDGAQLVGITVKAGGGKTATSGMGPGEGPLYTPTEGPLYIDDAKPASLTGAVDHHYFEYPGSFGSYTGPLSDLPDYVADTGAGQSDTLTKTIVEDQWVTLSLGDQADDILSATTGETGTDVDWASADGSESLTFKVMAVGDVHHRLKVVDQHDASDILTPQTDENGRTYWIVDAADLAAGKVQIGAAEDWAQEGLTFEIVARATEDDANDPDRPDTWSADHYKWEDSNSVFIKLDVSPDVDTITVTARNTGNEDTAIALTPSITMKDADGSETLVDSVYFVTADPDILNGVLNGSGGLSGLDLTFYEATVDGNNVVTLDTNAAAPDTIASNNTTLYGVEIPATLFNSPDFQAGEDTYTLSGLSFQPPHNSGNEGSYHLYATTQDTTGSLKSVTVADGTITVRAVADAPNLAVDGSASTDSAIPTITGTEDQFVALNITASVADDTEDLTKAELSGVPEGWQVGYYKDNGDGDPSNDFQTASFDAATGIWTLNKLDRLDDVVVKAPADWHSPDGAATGMKLTLWATEDGSDVTAGNTDDGIAVETAFSEKTFNVVIDADADAPNLIVQPKVTTEDVKVKLDILPELTDTDGSETLSVFISGNLLGGALVDALGNPAAQDMGDGTWKVALDQLDDLYYDPLTNFSGTVDLQVIARATEQSDPGETQDTVVDLPIIVRGQADALTPDGDLVTATNEHAGWFDAGLGTLATSDMIVDADNDGTPDGVSSESIAVVIKGLPDGVDLRMDPSVPGADDALRYVGKSGGKPVWAVEAGFIDAVQFKLGNDFSGTIDVPLVVTVTEADGHNIAVPKTLTLDVAGIADTPTVSLSGGADEDTAGGVPFTLETGVTDTTDGVEHISRVALKLDPAAGLTGLSLVINGQEYDLGTGTAADGFDIVLTTGTLTGDLDMVLKGVPEHWSADVPLQVEVTATDPTAAPGQGETSTVSTTLNVPITAVVDEPHTFSMTTTGDDAPAISSASGTAIDLNLAVLLEDLQDGSEHAHLLVEGVADGVVLMASDGSGTLPAYDLGGGKWLVPVSADTAADGFALKVDGAPDTSATLSTRLVVTDIDPDTRQPDVWQSDPVTTDVAFTGTPGDGGNPTDVAEPTVSVTPRTVDEDNAFTLDATVTPGSGDTVEALVIHGPLLPAGLKITSDTDFAFYTVEDDAGNTDYVIPMGNLSQVTIHPPEDYAGPIDLNISATARDGYWSQSFDAAPFTVANVTPVTETAADGGHVSASAQTTVEDSGPVAVDLSLQQADADGSEQLNSSSITVTLPGDLPTGAKLLLNGVEITPDQAGGSTYTLDIVDDFGFSDLAAANADFQNGGLSLSGLAVEPPADWHGSIKLDLSAKVIDPNGGTEEIWPGSVTVRVTPEAEVVSVAAGDVTAVEDAAIPLDIKVDQTGDLKLPGVDHGSERLSVVIQGVPAGMTIKGATNNGDDGSGKGTTAWAVKAAVIADMAADGTLPSLELVAPPDWAESISLTVTAYQFEADAPDMVRTATQSFDVTVTPVADTPYVNPQHAEGTEDIAQAISLNAISSDYDGSEVVTVRIDGAPEGATFAWTRDGTPEQVVVGADGTVTLTATGMTNLTFTGPEDVSGVFTMTATPFSQDGTSGPAEGAARSFTVTLTGDADVPTVTVADPSAADEGSIIALDLSVASKDDDGSESFSLVIGPAAGEPGIPEGTQLLLAGGQTVGLSQDGTFKLSGLGAGAIAGLSLKPPADWHGTLNLAVTATSVETDGGDSQAGASVPLTVVVDAVNDAPVVDVSAPDIGITGPSGSVVIRVLDDGAADPIGFSDPDAALDPDAAALSQLDVSLGNGGTGDSLGLTGMPVSFGMDGGLLVTVGGDTFGVAWNAGTSTLSFSGEGSYSQYQALAQSVILTNDGGSVEAGTRTVSFTAYDTAGAPSADTTHDSVQISITGNHTLGNAGEELQFKSDGTGAVLAGTDGNDALEIAAGALSEVTGMGGFDILTVMNNLGQGEDWTFTVDQADGSVSATSADGSKLDIVFEDDTAAQTDDAGDLLLDPDGSTGYIIFDEDESSRLDFEGIEKING